MKQLFLTSSIHRVAHDIAKRLPENCGRKLVFIITASELETEDLDWRHDDRAALVKAGFEVTDYTFTGKTREQVAADLAAYDIIHIEGGNTFYLLGQIQKANCADVICDLVEKGVPYIGCSAGSIVAGPDIYPLRRTEELEELNKLDSYTGLNLVSFIILPHWGQDYFKELYLEKRVKFNYNEDHKLFFLTDNQYIYVEDEWMKFIDVRLDK